MQEPLRHIAAMRLQECLLGLGLDPFRHHHQMQAARHGQRRHQQPRHHQPRPLGIGIDIGHQRLVDLEFVGPQAADIAQRRITSAKIVDRHQHPQRLERLH